MADIEIAYKGSLIASMNATGTKTLLTEGKYCEDDIAVNYVKPSGGSGNTPVASATSTSVTATGGALSLELTLSRAITRGQIVIEPDAETLENIYAQTSTSYYIVKMLVNFPIEVATHGSSSMITSTFAIAYRGSTGVYAGRTFTATTQVIVTISGTTLTLEWGATIAGILSGGTYNVTVWEEALS